LQLFRWGKGKRSKSVTSSSQSVTSLADLSKTSSKERMTRDDLLKVFRAAATLRAISSLTGDLLSKGIAETLSVSESSEVVITTLAMVAIGEEAIVFPGNCYFAYRAAALSLCDTTRSELSEIQSRTLGGSSRRSQHLAQAVGYLHAISITAKPKTIYALLTSDRISEIEFLEAMSHGKKHSLPLVVVLLDRSLAGENSSTVSLVKRETDRYSDAVTVLSACSCMPEDIVDKLEEAKSLTEGGEGPVIVVTRGCSRVDHNLKEMLNDRDQIVMAPDTLWCLKTHLGEMGGDLDQLSQFETQIKEELRRDRGGQFLKSGESEGVEDGLLRDAEEAPYQGGFENYQGPRTLATLGEALDKSFDDMINSSPESILVADIDLRRQHYGIDKAERSELYSDRVIEGRLSGSTRLHLACGVALAGRRPVVEIYEQEAPAALLSNISDELASLSLRQSPDASLPITIRVRYGDSKFLGSAAIAIADVYSPSRSVPCVVPSTPSDAVGLVTNAFRSHDAVVVLENSYARDYVKGEMPQATYLVPFGRADVIGRGHDLSIVTCGILRHHAHAVAETLFGEASVEVVDLRSVSPLDIETILDSVKRCSKVLILGEREGDFSARVASLISENGFWDLDAPIKVVCGLPRGSIGKLHHHYAGEVIDLPTIERAARDLLAT
jgi:2-oxoisovalerate dehydrogenase E1 component beta subunit